MKLKATISDAAPLALFVEFGGQEFASAFLWQVVGEILGVKDPTASPAEYYVQEPDESVTLDPTTLGVELRLTGVSRNGRKAAQFHRALAKLYELACGVIQDCLTGESARVQVFCVLMLDGDVETAPGSGVYSSVLETKAVWVTAKGVEKDAAPDEGTTEA